DIKMMMESAVYSLRHVKGAIFIGDNQSYISYSKWYSPGESPLWSKEKNRQAIMEAIGNPKRLKITSAYKLQKDMRLSDSSVLIGMPVRDLYSGKRYGILVFALGSDIFSYEAALSGNEGVETLITDENKRILIGSEMKSFGKSYIPYLVETYKDKKIHQVSQEIGNTGWKINYIVDEQVQAKDIRRFIGYVVLLMVSITILFFMIVMKIAGHYVGEIKRISRAIESYNPDTSIPVKIHLDSQDELYTIAHHFNKLLDRNNRLVKTLKQKNEEIRESVTRQKNAEIRSLEAQISPHFLYNTLDSINWMAIDAGEEEISNMLGSLGSLLRYSVSNSNSLVSFQAEIEWLKKYIFLQRVRFHDSFDCRYDLGEGAGDFPIYKMMLQPLIENSILHAFEDTKEGGLISLKAFIRKDNYLEISLKDNGKGIEKDVLNTIIKGKLSGNIPNNGIGLSNVVERLSMYYKNKARIEIKSQIGQGTEVIIVIPYISKL
ncbi:MAG TPA: histidine kinase, partial [Lachnospiraceae bacterium]